MLSYAVVGPELMLDPWDFNRLLDLMGEERFTEFCSKPSGDSPPAT